MQRSFVDGLVSNSVQPILSDKRAWNQPSITDEDVKNTAAKSSGAPETAQTDGPTS